MSCCSSSSRDRYTRIWREVESENSKQPSIEQNAAAGALGPLCFLEGYLCKVAFLKTFPSYANIPTPIGVVGGVAVNMYLASKNILPASSCYDATASIVASSLFSFGAYTAANIVSPAFGGLACCCITPLSIPVAYLGSEASRNIRVTIEASRRWSHPRPQDVRSIELQSLNDESQGLLR